MERLGQIADMFYIAGGSRVAKSAVSRPRGPRAPIAARTSSTAPANNSGTAGSAGTPQPDWVGLLSSGAFSNEEIEILKTSDEQGIEQAQKRYGIGKTRVTDLRERRKELLKDAGQLDNANLKTSKRGSVSEDRRWEVVRAYRELQAGKMSQADFDKVRGTFAPDLIHDWHVAFSRQEGAFRR